MLVGFWSVGFVLYHSTLYSPCIHFGLAFHGSLGVDMVKVELDLGFMDTTRTHTCLPPL